MKIDWKTLPDEVKVAAYKVVYPHTRRCDQDIVELADVDTSKYKAVAELLIEAGRFPKPKTQEELDLIEAREIAAEYWESQALAGGGTYRTGQCDRTISVEVALIAVRTTREKYSKNSQ